MYFFFFQAEDGIRDIGVTGVQTCALPICGGIYALRGHANIQGSTDIPTLFDLLPGYLPMPRAGQADLTAYLDRLRARTQKGYWEGADAYLVSLLKEYFGDAATADNDFGFGWLPRIDGDHGTYRTTMDMIDGRAFGYFVMGQNPAVEI